MSKHIVYFRTEGSVIAQIKIGYSAIELSSISDVKDPDKMTSNHKSKYLINGYSRSEIQPTFEKSWLIIPNSETIHSIQYIKQVDQSKLQKFVLIDPKSEAPGVIPAELSISDANPSDEDSDGDYIGPEYGIWQNLKYKPYRALYKLHREDPRYYLEDVDLSDITFYDKGELKNVELTQPINETYSVIGNAHNNPRIDLNLSSIVQWSQLEKMLTAPPIIGSRPCSISSQNTYRIIRAYIKDNIDKEHAVITSDYDFCFEVKKKYSVEPYTHTTEEKKSNGKSYAKPRLSHRLIKSERSDVRFFEMTHDIKKYSGYTIIPGFRGESIPDLINTIKAYLDLLIEEINKPLARCECCKGTGIEPVNSKNLHKAHKDMFPS